MAERWQLSGSQAEKYERYVASWFEELAVDLVERAELEPGAKVLHVGCGTGIVTRVAAPVIGASGSIVGTDLNEGMLAEAARHPPAGATVEWQQADATELPFDSDTFDALLCQQTLQFVPEKDAAVGEMRRVLRPGGRAAVNLWRSVEHNPYQAALRDGLARQVSEQAGQSMAAPISFGERDPLETVFVEAGFSDVQVDAVDLLRKPVPAREAIEGNLAAVPAAAEIQSLPAERYEALIDDVLGQLSPFITEGVLTVPMSVHVVLATA